MDSYQYQSGGYSLQSTTMVRTQPQTVVIVSTATPVGGDKCNGDFSDSALAFAFNGTAPRSLRGRSFWPGTGRGAQFLAELRQRPDVSVSFGPPLEPSNRA